MPLTHDSFSMTRRFDAPIDRVFNAWADPAMKRRWFVDNDGPDWKTLEYSNDFRVGGRERGRWQMNSTDKTMAGEHTNETIYLDIIPGKQIVYAYTMAMNGQVHFSSLTTVELFSKDGGTELRFTEQGAFAEGSDGIAGRQNGWGWLLDGLAKVLEQENA